MSKDEDNFIVSANMYGYENEDLTVPDEDKETNSLQRPFDPKKINVTPNFTAMYSIIARLQNGRIDMAPDFQRNAGIWSRKAKTRLIESLLIKLPLPAFYFDTTDDDRWVVIDGLQRLTTIKEFVVDNEWPLLAEDLEFLGDICGGKRYNELSASFRGNIDESQVMICKIMTGTPARVKFDIFRRINTGGQPLNSQEIRHALNPGRIISFLKELVSLEAFKKATCNNFDAKRMIDRECALRFLAFYENDPQSYAQPDFDRFLNDYMFSFNERLSSNPIYLDQLKSIFETAMERAYVLFENDAFRKRYDLNANRHPLNKSLFEAWAVNLAKLTDDEFLALEERKQILKCRFVELMKDDKNFDVSVTQGTAAISRVHERFGKIKELIQKVIHYAQ